MNQICTRSNIPFIVSAQEKSYCDARDIPLPTISPLERFREMFAFRNEIVLYSRKCDKTGQDIISIYKPNTSFPVYEREVWLSDINDPLQYGRPYDFTKPFFQQFWELSQVVPREAKIGANAENSPYVNLCMNVKNCYYTFGCLGDEDCMYSAKIYSCRDCVDCLYSMNCELCYQCTNCHDCYQVRWAEHSFNCRDSAFLYACRNCSNCFGCVGLEHKQYCIWNQQYSQQDYEIELNKLLTGKASDLIPAQIKFTQLITDSSYQYQSIINCEDCDGAYIENSKDCHHACFVKSGQELEHFFAGQKCKNCISVTTAIEGELLYRSVAIGLNSYNSQFCYMGSKLVDCQYCGYVFAGEKMFGCIGFPRRGTYCILNKQYSKEEYEELLPRIIAHMKSTGEWGQFFPMWMSDFPYTDTIAQEYFPITEGEGKRLSVHWAEPKPAPHIDNPYHIPDNIQAVDDSICQAILTDEISERAYRLQRKELEFYRKHTIPIPRLSFETRHLNRSQKLLKSLQ
ncbi:MAG: hypothetical protein HY817_04010 [Candidatus Abawacabacteria bacterium]|nr:hypothetical protein [Candidatus Abawacabacteria bacterium]